MRNLPAGLAARLGGGATTLCRCWLLTRRDGARLGFTDHDRDLAFAGVAFLARTGLEAAEATAELGFAVGGGEVAGALVAAGITEYELASGLYDGAAVETWLVDWSDVDERLLLDVGTIGEIRRSERAFVAELRGAMHRLDEEQGRLYRPTCSADLGDARCRVALADPRFAAEARVTATDGRLGFAAVGLTAHADGWFTGGLVTWTSGANAGGSVEVKLHRHAPPAPEIVLWQPMPRPIAVGDSFRITAGCDKRFATCRDKFGNGVNFRGFPHMPGDDFILRLPREGEAGLDGGSLFR
ncbi:DUF2163 domain-containing protein [Chelatococcus sp. SYSU_G07232]|uniref:DUF2163 domain-containing protein n=1 Tax=Chelatococcus albus TaxID=3047466 RepID=A0ABT7AI00_9HYPH|nr:DUF2163 domain-containing protein [Chelatococcus sp. SYSU_G07232]MDJ1159021.1 DUF2163 domain-containing protein [Chelatococcus sp. SYSU_G07232]